MTHLNMRTVAVALATVAYGIGAAHASTISAKNPGIYDVASVNTGGNFHSLWLNDWPGNNYWQLLNGAGAFTVTDHGATFKGTAAQNGDPAETLDIDISFKLVEQPIAKPTKCGSGGNCDDWQNWDYFRLDGPQSISGDGVTIHLSNMGPEGQLGLGANDKDPSEFGFSMWFNWLAKDDSGAEIARGRGDFNMDLTPVPLPAGGWLLIAGLGSLVALRRRRHTA